LFLGLLSSTFTFICSYKPKIRIKRDKTISDSYTFLNKSEFSSHLQPDKYQNDLETKEKTGTENLDEIYKRKRY
jgi:hypothetical protein